MEFYEFSGAKSYCRPLHQFKLLAMKMGLTASILVMIQLHAVAYSQEVSLTLRNVKITEAFRQISKQTGYEFLYNNKTLLDIPRVSVSVKKATLKEALDHSFKDIPLNFVIADKTVIISRKEPDIKIEPAPLATITGKALDKEGRPLAGVSITEKGTSKGTTTDESGNFTLTTNSANVILVVSYVGYETMEVRADGNRAITIQLTPSTSSLSDVVVIGYGTQTKSSLTSSVSEIKGVDMARRPVSNIQQAFQGLAPGVTAIDKGGAPGRSEATVRVRGITTFNINKSSGTYGGYDLTKNDALIIIDGIEQKLTDYNPDDIETVTILKDASSTAIYGSRATNGVILITTKRAKTNKLSVNYNGYYAIQQTINKPVMMDIESYMRLQAAAYTNSNVALPAKFTDESIETWVNSTDREKNPLPNTWFNTVLHTAPQHNHTLSVAGGNDFLKTRLTARYMDQDGLAANYEAKIREIKLNTDINVSKKIKLSADVNYRFNFSATPAVEPFQNLLHGSLWAFPKYADGTYGLSSQGNNPLMYAERSGRFRQYDENMIVNIKGDWLIVTGLKFSSQIGARLSGIQQRNFSNAYANLDKNTNINKVVANNSLSEIRNNLREYTWNNLLTYETQIRRHEIKALAGYSQIDNRQTFLSAYRERFYSNDIQSIGQGANDGTKSNNGFNANFGLQSYFGRVNYIFADRYLFEANGRYDGSSKFTGDKRFSFFPSFSAGWRISQENFWTEGLSKIMSNAKLRGSWGRTGNQSVDLYSYYPALTLSGYTFGGAPVQGYQQSTLANLDLGWETTTQTDVGLEMSFLNNRLDFTVDYYRKLTTNILLNLAIPATVGLLAPPQNAGSVENKGFEFSVNYRGNSQNRKLIYNVRANFSVNDNKVTDLRGTGPYIIGSDNYPRYIIKDGLPINTLWGYKTDGLFQTQQEVDGYPTWAANSKPGDVKYLDLNKDGKIDANDMTNIGITFPKYTFGLNTDFSYKNFDLNILFQGVAKVDTRLGGALSDHGNFEAFVHEVVTNNYWTPDRPNARFARPLKFDFRNGITSDRTIIDGSYLRVKNIQLGYTVPVKFNSRNGISRIRVYVSGTNLVTFSKLNEWNLDPEVEPGVAVYYPQTALYTFGVNVSF